MGQAPRPERARHDDQPTTLGDLLFAKDAKPSAPESEWAALVQAVAEGDQRALHALYSGMHRIVFTFIMKITNNRETAEELRKAHAEMHRGGEGLVQNVRSAFPVAVARQARSAYRGIVRPHRAVVIRHGIEPRLPGCERAQSPSRIERR